MSETTEFAASFANRLMNNAKLNSALVKAQRDADPLIRTEKNPTFAKPHVSSDAIISEGRECLNKHGLALLPNGFERLPEGPLVEADSKTTFILRGHWIRRWFKLLHESGECEIIGPYDWPTNPSKATPLHLACAATDTLSLAYVYRDILGFPRMTLEEFRAMERESEKEAYNASLNKPPVLPPAPQAKTQPAPQQSTQALKLEPAKATQDPQVVAQTLAAESAKIIDEMAAAMDAKAAEPHCPQCKGAYLGDVGKADTKCVNGHPIGTKEAQTTSAPPQQQPAAQSTVVTTQTPSAPTTSQTAPTNGNTTTTSVDPNLVARQTAMLSRLQKWRKKRLDAGAGNEAIFSEINAGASTTVVDANGFRRSALSDAIIKTLEPALKAQGL